MSIKDQVALVTMYRSLDAHNQKRISENIVQLLEQQRKKIKTALKFPLQSCVIFIKNL